MSLFGSLGVLCQPVETSRQQSAGGCVRTMLRWVLVIQ
jgi:hypothetical protein